MLTDALKQAMCVTDQWSSGYMKVAIFTYLYSILYFFLRVRIPEFFFSFSYSFSGQFELSSAVTNSGGFRRGSGGFGTDYFIFVGIFRKNERSSANRPPP